MVKNLHIAFLFPGQGAQSVGMGKDFFESFSLAREVFEEANEILSRDLSSIIFEGPNERLTETRNSQIGIYVTSIAILKVIQNQFPSLSPKVCAGLSLGEYTALTASGRVSFSRCLSLVQHRGEYMNEACETIRGTMAAIFGLSAEDVENMVSDLNLPQDLWTANFNCPGQTVISGTMKGVEKGIEAAKIRGARKIIPLQVHGAFHSGLMVHAERKLAPEIHMLCLEESSIDLVMNVPGNYVRKNEEIRENLIRQITHPVRWEQSIQAMKHADLFIEIGCGKTLAGLNRQMSVAQTISINKNSDLEVLAQILG